MKNTISLEQPHIGIAQRVKWQYVSLAAGLALAATAGAAFGATSSKPAEPATTRTASYAARPALDRDPGSVVFYLTGSAAQAAYATDIEEQARWIRQESLSLEPKRTVQVLDASNETTASNAKRLIDDAMAAANFTTTDAPRFVVVDLR